MTISVRMQNFSFVIHTKLVTELFHDNQLDPVAMQVHILRYN